MQNSYSASPEGQPGRSRLYCSEPCRKAAGLEVGRINRQLESLENRLANCRSSAVSTFEDEGLLELEIERQRGRLLELLAEHDGNE